MSLILNRFSSKNSSSSLLVFFSKKREEYSNYFRVKFKYTFPVTLQDEPANSVGRAYFSKLRFPIDSTHTLQSLYLSLFFSYPMPAERSPS